MEKIKSFLGSSGGKDILVVLVVILVSLSSFEVGRLSKDSSSSGIKITSQGQEASAIGTLPSEPKIASYDVSTVKAVQKPAVPNIQKEPTVKTQTLPSVPSHVGKSFFASNRGHKYYPVDCSAGKTIKQENRIYFSTKAEAEKAGYEPSASCD